MQSELQSGELVEPQSNHLNASLVDKLSDLEEAVEDACGNYEIDVEYSPRFDGKDRVSVIISSPDWVLNEGEVGMYRWQIILGPRGGLYLARRRTELSGNERDYLDEFSLVNKAWKILLNDIRRAI